MPEFERFIGFSRGQASAVTPGVERETKALACVPLLNAICSSLYLMIQAIPPSLVFSLLLQPEEVCASQSCKR
jgi:hypothetical protein